MTAPMTAERLRQVLDYDPETGVFLWKDRSRAKALNGGIAGTLYKGYRTIKIAGSIYAAHRLAWLYVHGQLPERWIDHINGDPTDNRIANLRDVSPRTNAENKRLRSFRAQSGLLGVTPHAYPDGDSAWVAHIYHHEKAIYIGRFQTEKEAAAAYYGAKRILHKGFAPPEFSPTGIAIAGD